MEYIIIAFHDDDIRHQYENNKKNAIRIARKHFETNRDCLSIQVCFGKEFTIAWEKSRAKNVWGIQDGRGQ